MIRKIGEAIVDFSITLPFFVLSTCPASSFSFSLSLSFCRNLYLLTSLRIYQIKDEVRNAKENISRNISFPSTMPSFFRVSSRTCRRGIHFFLSSDFFLLSLFQESVAPRSLANRREHWNITSAYEVMVTWTACISNNVEYTLPRPPYGLLFIDSKERVSKSSEKISSQD